MVRPLPMPTPSVVEANALIAAPWKPNARPTLPTSDETSAAGVPLFTSVPLFTPVTSSALFSALHQATNPVGNGTGVANLARTVLLPFIGKVTGVVVLIRSPVFSSPAQPIKTFGARSEE